MALANLTGQVLDDKYRIEKQLGRGGMGAVYLATHLGTDRPVAVKVITPQFMTDEEFVERFRREAKAAGRLRHPHVVNVTDFGFAPLGGDRVAYLVMEYLGGCTLAEILAEESQLDINWAVDIFEQTCSAIDAAHQQGILHRDIKPDNIWLEPNRRGGYTVKVLDFGLAKLGEAAISDEFLPGTEQQRSSLPSTTAGSTRTSGTPGVDANTRALGVNPTSPGASEFTEAATQVARPPVAEEAQTRILMPEGVGVAVDPRDYSEAATQLHPAPALDKIEKRESVSDRTPTRENQTVRNRDASQTAYSDDGLTRVGSILGTPLYMSPEQCRSEPLDARSDIYSLGVIAYQLLAGHTPFSGDPHSVMRQHIEDPPPPLKEKGRKIRRKMAAIVMSALAKDPADRPASAAGFASALRASSETLGPLVRRSFALYSEHFMSFFRVSLLVNLPLIFLAVIRLTNELLKRWAVLGSTTTSIIEAVLSILLFFGTFVTASVISGITIRLVTQLFLAPLRPIDLRLAYKAVKKRLKPLLITAIISLILCSLGLLLFIVPGIIMFINYSLSGPVVMMEGLKGRAALKRSKVLVKRARRTVIATLLVQWAIPAIASALAFTIILSVLKVSRVGGGGNLASQMINLATAILNVFYFPLITTMSGLLYLKTRQLGGETLREALSQFEEEDTPRSKWQQRMREQLQNSSATSR